MLRFSFSPTEDISIDAFRIALFHYIISKQRNEDLIIRIEDREKDRNIDGKDAETIALLDLFGIQYREVLYQSKNFRFHQAMAIDLLHRKKAFNCFCSQEELNLKKIAAQKANKPYRYDGVCVDLSAEEVIDNPKPFRVRIKKPHSPISFIDKFKGKLEFSPDDIDSFVLLEEDKTPTFNFASAVDDMLSDISTVICDEKLVLDSARQIYVRSCIGYDKEIEYIHLPSFSHQLSVKWLLEEGFLPQAISNYLILIGNNDLPQNIFTIDEAIAWFDIEKLSQSFGVFDMDELKAINQEHLKRLDDKELSRYVGFADSEIGKLAKLYLQEVSTTKELKEKIAPVFAKKVIPKEFAQEAKRLQEIIKEAPYFETYQEFKYYLEKKTNSTEDKFLQPLHYLLTGQENDLAIKDIYEVIKNYIKEIVK